ncbi:hypothetical protein Tco_0981953, partial [Tanacetum coccineum]
TFPDTLAEGTEGSPHLGPERPRVYSNLSPEDKERYNADIRATNILLQGLPKDIYSLINHYTDAKDIWDNVKMLLEGSELTKEDRESQLYSHVRSIIRVTHTEISSPLEDLSDIGSPRVVRPEGEGLPWMLDDPYVQVALQAPPSPDYIPGPEEPQSPPLPDFVPEPVYPEYMPQEDEVFPIEEQPLPAAASPTGRKHMFRGVTS